MTIRIFCKVINGHALFDKYRHIIVEDIAYRIAESVGDTKYVVPESYLQRALLQELYVLFRDRLLSLRGTSSCSAIAMTFPLGWLIYLQTVIQRSLLNVMLSHVISSSSSAMFLFSISCLFSRL